MLVLALACIVGLEFALKSGLVPAYRRVTALLRRMPRVLRARPRRELWKERAVSRLSARLWGALGRASLRLAVVLAPVALAGVLDRDARSVLLDLRGQVALLVLLVLYGIITRPFRKRLRSGRTPAS